MTDKGILSHYRLANPYISLAQAREIHRVELKFGHLVRIKVRQERLAQARARREMSDRLFGAQSVDDSDEEE